MRNLFKGLECLNGIKLSLAIAIKNSKCDIALFRPLGMGNIPIAKLSLVQPVVFDFGGINFLYERLPLAGLQLE
ncbi:hypothetical protein D3C80_912330 [compost metagenome]